MSNGNPPPVFTLTPSETFTRIPPEIPLDLTVKRSDFDEDNMNNIPYAKQIERQMSLPSRLDYHTSQYGPYGGRENYPSDTCSPTTPPPLFIPPRNDSSPSPPVSLNRAAVSPTQSFGKSYMESQKVEEPSLFEGGVLPKKRKNLWRPYDSRVALGEINQDSDSSDSTSGSSSDQDNKPMPMDPVKKRKMNMIHYAAETAAENISDYEKGHSGNSNRSLDHDASRVTGDTHSSPQKSNESTDLSLASENTSGYFTHMAEELTKSQLSLLSSYPEARDKMISGLKKRDIFGWGIKLMKPAPENTNRQQKSPAITVADSSQDSQKQNVCQDGEKTYIELQTVKTNNPPPQTIKTTILPPQTNHEDKNEPSKVETSPFKSPKPEKKKSVASPSKGQPSTKAVDNKTVAHNDMEKENLNMNNRGKVYIQTRDNVIESYDETANVPAKTRKGISLIDLVEEIEASALAKRMDEEDLEKRNSKNKRVTALLEQCNHVKLQALDFLMSNVLIQDKEPQFKQKNETVQKMLKGDKIGSVNMLDIIELQVEIGLN